MVGKYQIGVFVIVGVIGMCDAGESQALSLVLPILEDEWGITALDESLMGSFVYAGNNCIRGIGYLVGSLLSGFVGDRFGRRHPIVISSAIMFTVGMAGAFMPNFVLYTVFRYIHH
jgi:MFS family permease